jgi:antirestriction protein ArdC
MSNKIKNTKTAEQRRAQAEQLQASIAEQVDQLRNSEQWIRFLRFARSFHSYSLNNLILIMAQYPTATRVAGFRQWQARGRQVRRGEKSIKIFGYAEKKINSNVGEEQDAAAEDERIVYFPILSVFDLSQTDPIDPEDPLAVGEGRLNVEDPNAIAAAVIAYLTGQGWTVDHRTIRVADDYTDPDARQVLIETSLSPADNAATLLHEAAHVILHTDESASEYHHHRGIKETEAESVAYVVAGLLGLDTSPTSINYVASWSASDTDMIKDTAARVLNAVRILTGALIRDEAEHTA